MNSKILVFSIDTSIKYFYTIIMLDKSINLLDHARPAGYSRHAYGINRRNSSLKDFLHLQAERTERPKGAGFIPPKFERLFQAGTIKYIF